jgi:hypothetical protein
MVADLAFRLDAIERRLAKLEAASSALGANVLGPILGSARVLPLLAHGRRPNFWRDEEVSELVTRLHRRVEVKRALAIIADAFGQERTPSRSAVHRYWLQLDQLARKAA